MNICRDNLPLLAGEAITKSYDGNKIIEEISVSLFSGELVSILGLSGIGKTTLFNILSGLEYPDSGRVLLSGKEITGKTGLCSYMQQKDLLLPFKTVLDNVALPLLLRGESKKAAREKAASYFEEFGLAGYEKNYPDSLSGGMRQRAAVLRSYLFSGEIMLMDEPFSALDAITKSAMHEWYREISARHSTSSFLITHDIDEAILLSDRIYIMAGSPGKIEAEFVISSSFGRRDSEFAMSEEFLHYKRSILQSIKT